MTSVHIGSAGVVCHAGRGLAALIRALANPAPQPATWTVDEIMPPVTADYLAADFIHTENRIAELAEAAVTDALVGYSAGQREHMALFVACSSTDLNGRETSYAAAVANGEPALAWDTPGIGRLAERLARRFGLGGRQYTFNTACSSGASALLYALAALRRGHCERALVVGLECPGRVTLAGFNSLLLLTQSQCRPFDHHRDGLILGEAGSAVVLEACPQGPDFSGMRLLGGATACDSSNVTRTGAKAVCSTIEAAMDHAGTRRIDVIKAHGTGTPDNDAAEAAGLGMCVDASVPMTSLKPVLGHTLGACGVLETLAMATCWQAGFLPPTSGFETVDPDLGVEPVTRRQALPPGTMLLNYFAFGGNNAALVMEYTP